MVNRSLRLIDGSLFPVESGPGSNASKGYSAFFKAAEVKPHRQLKFRITLSLTLLTEVLSRRMGHTMRSLSLDDREDRVIQDTCAWVSLSLSLSLSLCTLCMCITVYMCVKIPLIHNVCIWLLCVCVCVKVSKMHNMWVWLSVCEFHRYIMCVYDCMYVYRCFTKTSVYDSVCV